LIDLSYFKNFLFDKLCGALQSCGWTFHSGPISLPQVVAEQVKEKFGSFRFYFRLEHTDQEWLNSSSLEKQRSINENIMIIINQWLTLRHT
jgi:hypothetical protein